MKTVLRIARSNELQAFGELVASEYAKLDDFPSEEEQPEYYDSLRDMEIWAQNPGVEIWIASTPDQQLAGGVVFFSHMEHYGSGGIAPMLKKTAGFRFLVVNPLCRQQGIGRKLISKCVERTHLHGHGSLVIHTTKSMKSAWCLYESYGFERNAGLDFMQGELPVFGFSYQLG